MFCGYCGTKVDEIEIPREPGTQGAFSPTNGKQIIDVYAVCPRRTKRDPNHTYQWLKTVDGEKVVQMSSGAGHS